MLTPFLLGVSLLVILPLLATVGLAFSEFDALSPPTWKGLGNFSEIFQRGLFWIAARNSLLFVLLAVPLRVGGALLLALFFNHRRRAVALYRSAVYLPTIIPDVAYALIWLWIFNPIFGPLNLALQWFGIEGPAWLGQKETALLAIVLMSLFQIGEGFLVLLSGLQDAPPEYYHAAQVDGATRWQMFRWITLPLLGPWLLLLTIRDILWSTQSTFAPAYLMTGGRPHYATLFMPLLIFEEAFDRFRFGQGSAMMVVMLAAIGLLLYGVYRLVGGWGYQDDV